MTILDLVIDNFTVIDSTTVPFAPTLTVVTGKPDVVAHTLALVYSLYQAGEAACAGDDDETGDDPIALVEGVFEVDDPTELTGPRKEATTRVKLRYDNGTGVPVEVGYGIDEDQDATASLSFLGPGARRSMAVLLQPTDVLADYPVFHAAGDDDAVPMDRGRFDLCLLLSRGDEDPPKPVDREAMAPALAVAERALGGSVQRTKDRFDLLQADGTTRPLRDLPKGLRVLGQLCRLLANGSLLPGDVLLWDHPADLPLAALNEVLAALLAANVQIIVGTADSPLSLSLLSIVIAQDATGAGALEARVPAIEA
jgi:hypothetical protein